MTNPNHNNKINIKIQKDSWGKNLVFDRNAGTYSKIVDRYEYNYELI